VTPPSVCGDGAESESELPMISVFTYGVASLTLLALSVSPGGSLASVRSAVSGYKSTLAVSVRPPASVAVRRSSRWVGYSWPGAVNEPLLPGKVCTVCS
jgi:hypothetical protein